MWALWVLSSCSHCFPPPHISTSSLHHIDKALNCRILDPEVLLLLFIHQSCLTLLQPARLLCPWDFPGKNTGVGCPFLLQVIVPTQGWNSNLLHCRRDLYCCATRDFHILEYLTLNQNRFLAIDKSCLDCRAVCSVLYSPHTIFSSTCPI